MRWRMLQNNVLSFNYWERKLLIQRWKQLLYNGCEVVYHKNNPSCLFLLKEHNPLYVWRVCEVVSAQSTKIYCKNLRAGMIDMPEKYSWSSSRFMKTVRCNIWLRRNIEAVIQKLNLWNVQTRPHRRPHRLVLTYSGSRFLQQSLHLGRHCLL